MRNIRSLVSLVLVVATAPLLSACSNAVQPPPTSRASMDGALLALEKILWPTYFRKPEDPPKKEPHASVDGKRQETDRGAKDWHSRKRAEHPASIRHRRGAATYAQNRKARELRISRRGRTAVIELYGSRADASQLPENIDRRLVDYLGEKRPGNGRDPLVLLLVLRDKAETSK
jgi:hypothetical protein